MVGRFAKRQAYFVLLVGGVSAGTLLLVGFYSYMYSTGRSWVRSPVGSRLFRTHNDSVDVYTYQCFHLYHMHIYLLWHAVPHLGGLITPVGC